MGQVNIQLPSQSSFALHSRTFRIFMSGSLITRIGDWMDLVILNWAVLQFTNSPLHLGIINACRLVPTFLLSLPAGVLADRFDWRKLLIGLQIGMMVLTFCLGFLVEARQSFWLFAFIVILRSMVVAVDTPIRNALVPNLVPQSSISSAIAINTMVINLSRMIGPALAGVLLSMTDIANLFYLNGWGTFAVLFSLLMIRTDTNAAVPYKKDGKKATLREAADYVKSQPSLQSLLILAVVPMVFGFPYTTMMPLFSRDLYNLGPEGFGLLLSISSIGAIVGSTWLSLGKDIKAKGKWLIYSIMGFGLSLLLFIGTTNLFLAGAAMFLVGFTSQTYRTLSRITLQLHVPDRLRGRILSIALMDRGFIPLGALLIGAIATWAGTLWAGSVMGLGCIVITSLFLIKRSKVLKL